MLLSRVHVRIELHATGESQSSPGRPLQPHGRPVSDSGETECSVLTRHFVDCVQIIIEALAGKTEETFVQNKIVLVPF